jgi:dipeptidyl aminopeptidase/acylaminoacyl peptidase
LTAEDLASLAFVHEAAISPDGDRVAYAVRRMDVDANRYRASLRVAPVDGSTSAVEWTDGSADDATPRWSPDGRSLAFTSDRGPVPQGRTRAPKNVFLVERPGTEPRQLAGLADDCGDLAWLPDGSGLIVTLKDPAPAHAAQPEDAPKVYERLRYKTDDAGLLDLRRKHLWIVPLDGSAPRTLTGGDWDDTQPAPSPDGSHVAFTSNRSADRDRNTVSDIWVVPLAGGAPRRITTEEGQYTNASWSPDGSWITCLGTADAVGAGARNTRVWRFALAGGEGVDLLRDWDRTTGSRVMTDARGEAAVLAPAWTGDGRVLFIGSDQGTANLYSCKADGGDVRAETLGAHQVVTASLDKRTRCFAAVIATATSPGDVATGQPGGGMRAITSLNADLLGARYIAPPEHVEFTGADGWTIEGWLLKPRGFDPARTWPLVLEVHGGPHGAYGHSFFHEFQLLAGRGYAVLYLNPRGSHGYGDTFVRACVGDWGGKEYEDLMAGVDHALGLGWIDPERLYVTGGSYGGFMTNWIVGHTDRFKAAVTQRSISNNISAFGTSDIGWHFWQLEMGDATPWRDEHKLVDRSPLTYVTNVRTPLLILHAEKDYRCPIEQAEQLFVALKVLGREAVFVRYQEDTHELTRGGKPRNRIDHARRIADWFDAHP